MSNLVSIITPCLNSEKTIERTIVSVLKQSYINIQYIVVDGKSSDKTLEILQKYQEIDSRIFVLSKKDNSMTEALNRGLKLAKGDIVASLNADDWYQNDAISHVVEIYKKRQFDCLIGNTQFIDDTGKLLYITKPWLASWSIIWHLIGCITPESSVFYGANCIKKIGYFNEKLKYTQDLEYYFRILKKSNISYTNHLISNFCVSENQYSTRLRPEMEKEVVSFIKYKKMRKILGGTSLSTPMRILLAHRVYTPKQLYEHIYSFLVSNLNFTKQ